MGVGSYSLAMTTSPRSSANTLWDMVGYVALVLITVVAGFLYFQDTTPPKAPEPAPVSPRVTTPPESLFDRLNRQARAGDVVSQRQLGQLYFGGMEVKEDNAEAVKWLRMAADKGDMIAARLLGTAYSGGLGVAADPAEAVSWWRVAASKGDDEAAFSLALACFNGKGVEKSQTEGVRFCRLAAERGNHRAQYSLGYWYYHGTFLPQSFGDAFTWFRKSAVKGHPYAQSYVGLMYLKGQSVTQSDSEARRWFEFSVNHGSGAGHLYLAQLYFDGKGVAKDDAKALGILTKGALLGHSPSQAELGRRLEAGDGVVGDPVEASAWYDLAVRGGEQDAKPARDALYRSLSAAQVSAARARAAAITSQIEAEEAARRSRP